MASMRYVRRCSSTPDVGLSGDARCHGNILSLSLLPHLIASRLPQCRYARAAHIGIDDSPCHRRPREDITPLFSGNSGRASHAIADSGPMMLIFLGTRDDVGDFSGHFEY